MHEKTDEGDRESRGNLRIEYAVPLRSLRLGLTGKADVVEFHLFKENSMQGVKPKGKWQPFPVEYKRGKPKKDNCDKVQLCAQGLCLEEMLNIEISKGALFYGKTRRRQDVLFNNKLRQETEKAAKRVHKLIAKGETPKPVYSQKCESCSFVDLCLPKTIGKSRSANKYIQNAIKE